MSIFVAIQPAFTGFLTRPEIIKAVNLARARVLVSKSSKFTL